VKNVEPEIESGRGLTWRSMLGILYAAIVIQPAVIWVYLSTGNVIAVSAIYATILVFGELAAFFGKPLRKQEILVFMIGCVVAVAGATAIPSLIYNIYFRRHDLVASYGLTNQIPNWFAPPPSSPVWELRTFFHPDMLLPIALFWVMVPLMFCVDLSLGFLTRELYVEHEKLPFPLQQVDAQLCTTLAERSPQGLKVFMISAVLAFSYGILLYGIPTIGGAALNVYASIIPIPWVDLNNFIKFIFPGGSLGVATDLTIIVVGLVLPPTVTISMFIGSFALYFIGNGILVRMGLFTDWTPEMSLSTAWQRSVLHFWAGPNVMLAIAAGILPLIFHPKPFIGAFKSLLKLPAVAKRGTISLKMIMALFLVGTLGAVALAWILVPTFPVWIFILLSVGWIFVLNLISARSIGLTGVGIANSYIKEGAILASGYARADVWFAPTTLPAVGVVPNGAMWCANFKTAELTETWPMDIVKAGLMALVIGFGFAFLYTQMFWAIAPVPSSLFPAPFWDVGVTMTSLFVSRNISVFRPDWMAATFIAGLLLQVLVEFTHIPISPIGVAVGATQPIAFPMGYIVGLIIAKVLGRQFGKDWVAKYRANIVAGVFTGEGLIVAFSAAAAMVFKAIWVKPF